MKKFYASLAMLTAFGVAFAAPGFNNHAEFSKADTQRQPKSVNIAQMATNMNKKPAKLPTSVEELAASYQVIGLMGLQGAWPGYTQGDVVFFPSQDNENQIIAYGINPISSVPVIGDVDLKAGTVSFANRQVVGNYQGYDVYFMHYQWNATGDGADEVNSPIVGQIVDLENGGWVIDFPFDEIMAVWIPDLDGGFVFEYGLTYYPRPAELNNDGWKDAGTATVSQLWYQVIVESDSDELIGDYTVPFQVSEQNPNLIRLVDPYGAGTPYEEYNASFAKGSIIFDITNPEAVAVRRCYDVILGYYTDGNGNPIEDDPILGLVANYSGFMMADGALYPGNQVGYYVYEDFSTEDIADTFGINATFEDNTITIGDPNTSFSWFLHDEETTGMLQEGDLGTPTIVLNYSEGGVGSINSSDLNAPVRYYNLQGMEISNPAKGQLVIKKQGNQTSKYIAK